MGRLQLFFVGGEANLGVVILASLEQVILFS